MLLTRIAVNGLALLVAGLLVPQIEVDWGKDSGQALVTLLVLAVVFGLINTFVRPVLSLLSIPIGLLTLGLSAFLINAGLLLLLAGLLDRLGLPLLTVGGFPPDLSTDALVGAILGSLVISAVSTAMSVLIRGA